MLIDMLTHDGVKLIGHLYTTENPIGVILLNPGTATRTLFYERFVEFLTKNHFHVLLWNYRGIREADAGTLASCSYNYSEIGFYDIPAAIDKVKSLFPNMPLYCIGHSAGATLIGLGDNFHKLDGIIAVAASTGYLGGVTLGQRIKGSLFFRFFAPISSSLYGYVPASKLKLGEDLPINLVKEWGNWTREKDWFFSPKYYGKTIPDNVYKNFNVPTHVFIADDDEISTKENVNSFWEHVVSSKPIRFTYLKAADVPSKQIGHFGYFRHQNQNIWNAILEVLIAFFSNKEVL